MKSNREKIFPSWNSISKGLVVIKVHVSRFRKKCMSQYSILAIENIWTWTVMTGKKPTVWKFNQDKRDLFLMTGRLRGRDFFSQSRAREPASILAGKRYSSRHSTTQRECRCGFDKLCYISFTIYHHSSSIKILTSFTSLVKKCTQKLSGVSIFLRIWPPAGRSDRKKKKKLRIKSQEVSE